MNGISVSAKNVFINGWPVEISLHHPYHQLVLNEFKLDSGLVVSAKNFISQVAKDTGAEIFVGVHVRRTDYGPHLKRVFKGRLLSKRVGLKVHIFFNIVR